MGQAWVGAGGPGRGVYLELMPPLNLSANTCNPPPPACPHSSNTRILASTPLQMLLPGPELLFLAKPNSSFKTQCKPHFFCQGLCQLLQKTHTLSRLVHNSVRRAPIYYNYMPVRKSQFLKGRVTGTLGAS